MCMTRLAATGSTFALRELLIVRAAIDRNNVTRLAEGTTVGSVLGIGLQTRDSARLTATADSDSETDIGSSGADCEGLFTNQTGGTLVWTVDHNLFEHGIGGASCNGGEFFTGQGDGTQSLRISDSLFYDDPGDMLEENNLGTGSTMDMTLDHVTVAHTTLATPAPAEPPIPAKSFGSFSWHLLYESIQHGARGGDELPDDRQSFLRLSLRRYFRVLR